MQFAKSRSWSARHVIAWLERCVVPSAGRATTAPLRDANGATLSPAATFSGFWQSGSVGSPAPAPAMKQTGTANTAKLAVPACRLDMNRRLSAYWHPDTIPATRMTRINQNDPLFTAHSELVSLSNAGHSAVEWGGTATVSCEVLQRNDPQIPCRVCPRCETGSGGKRARSQASMES